MSEDLHRDLCATKQQSEKGGAILKEIHGVPTVTRRNVQVLFFHISFQRPWDQSI
jgi:hypothetical protein